MSLPLIISGHGFCGHPWLSRSEGGPFSLAAREGLTLVLGFWEPYILYHRPIRHNPGVSLPLIISGHGFCGHPWLSRSEGGPFSFSARERMTLVLGFWEIYIYILYRRPIRHNPGVSLPLIISGHGFCGHPWLSRSEGGPFSLAAREGLTLVLGFWELYILYPGQ